MVLHCTALNCAPCVLLPLYCTALHCTATHVCCCHCTALYCTVLRPMCAVATVLQSGKTCVAGAVLPAVVRKHPRFGVGGPDEVALLQLDLAGMPTDLVR